MKAFWRKPMRGFAIVAVMWMIAVLSILVSGLVTASRSELKSALVAKELVESTALGDAAIELAMLMQRSDPDYSISRRRYSFDIEAQTILVEVIPAGGLVDLNLASDTLLLKLFTVTAAMDQAKAEKLLENLMVARSSGPVQPNNEQTGANQPLVWRGGPLVYPEDLLQFEGVGFDEYDRIRRLITVIGGTSGVDLRAAPLEVLSMLTDGDLEAAQQIFLAVNAGDPAADFTAIDGALQSPQGSGTYRVDAYLMFGERAYRRTLFADLDVQGADGAPWKVMRMEAPVGIDPELLNQYEP